MLQRLGLTSSSSQEEETGQGEKQAVDPTQRRSSGETSSTRTSGIGRRFSIARFSSSGGTNAVHPRVETLEEQRARAVVRAEYMRSALNNRTEWEERTIAFLAQGNARLQNGTPLRSWLVMQDELKHAKEHGMPLSQTSRSVILGSAARAIKAASFSAKKAEARALSEFAQTNAGRMSTSREARRASMMGNQSESTSQKKEHEQALSTLDDMEELTPGQAQHSTGHRPRWWTFRGLGQMISRSRYRVSPLQARHDGVYDSPECSPESWISQQPRRTRVAAADDD